MLRYNISQHRQFETYESVQASIMAPPQAISILSEMEVLLFRCPIGGLLLGAISGQGPHA